MTHRPTPPPLLTVTELARRLGLRASTIRELADARKIPAARAGSEYLFDANAVEGTLLAQAALPAPRRGRR